VWFDEPAPLGGGRAPNAATMLGAAVGNCLAASLAFCLRKSRVEVDGLTAHITTHVAKNDQGKFRISGIDVELAPEFDAANQAKFERCERLFEDFCIVTQSVRQGIPVNVTVKEREVVASR
jgi:organic hydroperoxide reductase OsmC/OhrA